MSRRTTWAVAIALAITAPLASGQNEIVVGGGTRPPISTSLKRFASVSDKRIWSSTLGSVLALVRWRPVLKQRRRR